MSSTSPDTGYKRSKSHDDFMNTFEETKSDDDEMEYKINVLQIQEVRALWNMDVILE